MPTRPASCRVCGRTEREAGRISLSGLCAPCGADRQLTNIAQLQARSGPYYERWARGLINAGQAHIAQARDAASG